MPLVDCPDCNRSVSDFAPACLGCGRPVSTFDALAVQVALEEPKAAVAQKVEAAPAPSQAAGEHVFFRDADVTVTSVRVQVRAATYAMSNVTSVSSFVHVPPKPGGFVAGALLFLAPAAFMIYLDKNDGIGWLLGVIGALLLLPYVLSNPKPMHWVRIGTAGAEANAIYSHDAEWTRCVVAAINDAILRRG